MTIVKIDGYCLLRNDKHLTQRVLETGELIYETAIAELPEVKALQWTSYDNRSDGTLIRPIVLDVGAYVGDTALIFLNLNCEVHAFEPYLDAFRCLEYNCDIPDSGKSYCYSEAVGDGRRVQLDGMGEDNGNLGTRMVRPVIATDKNNGIRTRRLDDMTLHRCDFIKIDVEGFELPVLWGAKKLITKYKPKILIEAYDTLLARQGFNRQQMFDYFTEIGYKWRVAIGQESDDRCDYLAEPNG